MKIFSSDNNKNVSMEKAVKYRSQKTNLMTPNDKNHQHNDGKNTLEKEVRSLKKLGTNLKENPNSGSLGASSVLI